jgi:hypothetical protein
MDENLAKHLTTLAQMDTDAVAVYDEALKHVTDEDVKKSLEAFRGEHEFHAKALSEAILRLFGTAPVLHVDLMGHIVDWVTAMRSMSGTEGALHALKTAEDYHNSHYKDATAWDTGDDDLKVQVQQFYRDEQHHLEYVEARLGAGVSQR